MCCYCEDEKIIIEKQTADECVWGWGLGNKKVSYKDYKELEYTESLFIDRGYLRFVDLHESGCLDHGSKIKINYCPFCGNKF